MKDLYPLLLEKRHQITFHQRCINSLMIEVNKYLKGRSPDTMNDIFKLREIRIISASLTLFKNRIQTWKCEDCPCRSCKIFIENVGYI